jgi:choline kinase
MTSAETSQSALPAVILAAGRGLRLQRDTEDVPKPLATLLGQTLLERAVASCQRAGVAKCYIVVGYDKERIMSQIIDLDQRMDFPVQAVENPHWEAGNGTSAHAVQPYVDDAFLLIMCDHVFDPALLRLLMEAGCRRTTCLLAVDRRTDQVFDLEDATKVQVERQSIAAIGKQLTTFNAIDTGLFLCRPALFKALEQARMMGDASLSGGMRQLIQAGQLEAVDIGDGLWIDVDTPASLAYAERALAKVDSLTTDRGDSCL